MPLNPEAVGTVGEPYEASWNSKDALLYAVGIGAGTDELVFTTENTNGVEQRVFPTFAVVIGWGAGSAMRNIGTFNPALLVHGQQAITAHKPIPVSGSASLQGKVVAMYDKGKAAVVVTETVATDLADGQPLFTNVSSAFIRGEGGWGGDRGPSGPQNVPPERCSRSPGHLSDVTRSSTGVPTVGRSQSAAQRPVVRSDGRVRSSDPPRSVHLRIHRAGVVAHACAEATSTRFRHIEGRFASPVLPGDALTVSMWEVGDGSALFTTSVGDRAVIDQGLVRFD